MQENENNKSKESGNITDLTEIKMIIRKHYEQLQVNKLK